MIGRKTITIGSIKSVLVLSLLFSATHGQSAAQGRYNEAEGKYLDPQVKTNVNKVDPLFGENIHDYKSFEREMLEHKKAVAAGVGKGAGTRDVVGAEEAENTARDLSQISANDLESRGRAKGAANPMFNEIFVDYSKPGNMQIKKDMEEIATASGNMMKVILGMLKDLGVDCKSVKGNTQIEPQYHIDLKSRTDRDKGETVYDKFFCEQPRREYHCTDEVTVTCKRKGIKWGEWQDKEIRVSGSELISFCSDKHMFRIVRTRERVFDYFLQLNSWEEFDFDAFRQERIAPEAGHILEARKFLATKHEGATIDNIAEEMSSSSEGDHFSISGRQYCGRALGSKDYAFQTYVINYKYREGSPACLEWSEDWGEECRLQN